MVLKLKSAEPRIGIKRRKSADDYGATERSYAKATRGSKKRNVSPLSQVLKGRQIDNSSKPPRFDGLFEQSLIGEPITREVKAESFLFCV